MSEYEEFLARKAVRAVPSGLAEMPDLSPHLFPHQRYSVEFLLRMGRAAAFLDTGLGKTLIQLEWAQKIVSHTGKPVLILAPLAVAAQTVREGAKFGYEVARCSDQADVQDGINIANYERLEKFDAGHFIGVILDESSILKSLQGSTKRALCESFVDTPFRLCCTATPSPNDHAELGNHADFLGIMSSNEMLQKWFINDTATASQNWRLKGHAADDFWDWVASWAVCVSTPSDIGESDDGFSLPKIKTIRHVIPADLSIDAQDTLFRMPSMSATNLHKEKRLSANDRAARVANIIGSETGESWLIWCDTDYEADALGKLIPSAVEVRGSMPTKRKEAAAIGFCDGSIRVLVSKPRIFGFGLNFQHCARMAFVGVSYSYERFYQAVRRCWRFGQAREVHAHIVMSETEEAMWSTVSRKAEDHSDMKAAMLAATKRARTNTTKRMTPYNPTHEGKLPLWLAA